MIREQQGDPFCTQIHAHLNDEQQIPFEVNEKGYLLRFIESQPQIVLSHAFQQRGLLTLLRFEPTHGEENCTSR